MKYLIIILLLLSFNTSAQEWITDNNFEKSINTNEAFGDDETMPIVVEFWAEFNSDNSFSDWSKLKNATYYRVNIAKAPNAKKKYKVRMAPTLIIFKDGIKEVVFKAGLDLVLPADLNEIQEAINEINKASKF